MNNRIQIPSDRASESYLATLKTRYFSHRKKKRRGALELSRMKRSDFVLYSPGNSGRTWLRVMLTRLFELHYGLESGEPIRFDNRHKLDRQMPKIAVTHNRWLPYFKKPRHLQECKQYYSSTVLILVRNPLDTCVSQYFQWQHRSKDENIRLKGWPERTNILSLRDFLLHPDTGVDRLCSELNMWLRESVKIRHARIVRYEDLLENPEGELEGIAKFYGVNTTIDNIREAVEFASFDNMRQREATAQQPGSLNNREESNSINEEAFKSRRGKNVGYSQYLSADDCSYFEQLVGSKLSSDFGYSDLPDIRPMTISGIGR